MDSDNFDFAEFRRRMTAARAQSDQFSAMLRDSELLVTDINTFAENAMRCALLFEMHAAERTNTLGYMIGVLVAAVDIAYNVEVPGGE